MTGLLGRWEYIVVYRQELVVHDKLDADVDHNRTGDTMGQDIVGEDSLYETCHTVGTSICRILVHRLCIHGISSIS